MPFGNRLTISVVSAAVALAVTLAACSSSSSSTPAAGSGTSSGTGTASGSAIKIGVLSDLTGAASSGYATTEVGVKAYIDGVNADGGINGHKLEYVMADSASSPTGALTAAQLLVEKDKVFAIVSDSNFFFGAAAYTLKAGVPVAGAGFDGTEWIDQKNTNLFKAIGNYDPTAAYTIAGQMVKKLGATTCAAMGYIESASASGSAKSFNTSCKAAGLKAPYLTQIHFGTTDVGPVALGMKSDGVDAAWLSTVTSTGFALAAALKQVGVKTTAIILPGGYGGDLLSSPPAVQAADGFYFLSQHQPLEMNTAATQVVVKRYAAVGYNTDPTYAQDSAYIALAAIAAGIKAARTNLSQSNVITSLRAVTDFDAEGLLAPSKVNFSDYNPPQECGWFLQLQGKKFIPLVSQGLSPVCGTKISS